jgi:hypothetical protein
LEATPQRASQGRELNKVVSAFAAEGDALACAESVIGQIEAASNEPPSALIVFASPSLALASLLQRLEEGLSARAMVGCSSAGEFADENLGTGAVSALAIWSDEIEFEARVGRGIKESRQEAAAEFAEGLDHDPARHPYRYILILTDALAGHTEDFLAEVNHRTAGSYQLFGGGAGDDGRFESTYVFKGSEILQNAAVGLVMKSPKPFGIGVQHGWQPIEPGMRATEAEGIELVSLNAEPVLEVLQRHASATGQKLDEKDPMPFFLHNVLGVAAPGGYKIRVPLGFTERGGLICATEIPVGATVHFMKTAGDSAKEAAADAAATAIGQLGAAEPAGVMFFDCVATRLRLGNGFGEELEAVRKLVAPAAFVGCNSYGQVARVDGQFSGFHNCTAVVCAIPS